MAIDSNRLLGHVFLEIHQEHVERDAILYALGIGLGADRLDATDLNFLLEKRLNLLPTLAVTLASSAWGGYARVVHSAQHTAFARRPVGCSQPGPAKCAHEAVAASRSLYIDAFHGATVIRIWLISCRLVMS
jgi:hypothetical protein